MSNHIIAADRAVDAAESTPWDHTEDCPGCIEEVEAYRLRATIGVHEPIPPALAGSVIEEPLEAIVGTELIGDAQGDGRWAFQTTPAEWAADIAARYEAIRALLPPDDADWLAVRFTTAYIAAGN